MPEFFGHNPERDEIIKSEQTRTESGKLYNRRQIIFGLGAMLGMAACRQLPNQETPSEARPKGTRPEIGELSPAEQELSLAMDIIESKNPERLLESRFLVSAIYYSDKFIGKLESNESDENENYQIIIKIRRKLTPEFTKQALHYLSEKVGAELGENDKGIQARPLRNFDFGYGVNHRGAIDLFTEEKSTIGSMSRGIVVLSETGWNGRDQFSTTSPKGGNSVIIYNPDNNEFNRYCHLEDVFVSTGEIMRPNTVIGTVGHTGTNASKPGHGQHLHLEIHPYDKESGEMNYLNNEQLKKRVQVLK